MLRGVDLINYIWFIMIFFGILVGLFTGNGEVISKAIINSADSTVSMIIGLVGLMCFWCGVMKVAEKSGFTESKVKTMLHRTRQKLLKQLKEEGLC